MMVWIITVQPHLSAALCRCPFIPSHCKAKLDAFANLWRYDGDIMHEAAVAARQLELFLVLHGASDAVDELFVFHADLSVRLRYSSNSMVIRSFAALPSSCCLCQNRHS